MRPILVVVLLAPAFLTAGIARATPPGDAGASLYRRYCAACHGMDGRGDGPVAPALGEVPTDLTSLAKRNGGTFPFNAVVEAIDGTRSVRAHGVSEMPVWGDVFHTQPEWDVARHIDARGKMVLITEYLRSIQAQ